MDGFNPCREFFSVVDNDGVKSVKYQGYVYYIFDDWRLMTPRWCFVPVPDEPSDELAKAVAAELELCTQDVYDLTYDEAVETCKEFYDGEGGKQLEFGLVCADTPYGDYWFQYEE